MLFQESQLNVFLISLVVSATAQRLSALYTSILFNCSYRMLLKPSQRCLKSLTKWNRKMAKHWQSKALLFQTVMIMQTMTNICSQNINLYFSGKICLKSSWKIQKVVAHFSSVELNSLWNAMWSICLIIFTNLRSHRNAGTWKCTAEEGKGCRRKWFAENPGKGKKLPKNIWHLML